MKRHVGTHSLKTWLKIIVAMIMFKFMMFLIIYPFLASKENEESTTYQLILLSINDNIIKSRLKVLNARKTIKINREIYEIPKSRTIELFLQAERVPDLLFNTYRFQLSMPECDIINEIQMTTCEDNTIQLTNTAKCMLMLLYFLCLAISLSHIIFVAEIWTRKKGATILQLIACVAGKSLIYLCYKFMNSLSMVNVNEHIFTWSFFVIVLSYFLLFLIFVFRYMNEKFLNGRRSKRTSDREYKNDYSEIMVV